MPTVWPFAPNIRQAPYVVSREYRTEIITSRSGKEQARALRQTPRKRIEYLTGVTGDCLRAFDRSMVTAQRTQLAIPDRVRFTTLAGALASGNSSVAVASVPSWLVEDVSVVLVSGSAHELATVASVVGTTVTFDDAVVKNWSAGARLHPALVGYLATSISAPLISPRGVVEVQVSFEADPGTEAAEDEGSAAATLGGREVFLTRPNRWVPIDLDRVQEGRGDVDYGFGRVKRFFPVAFSTRLFEASWTGCDFEKSDALRAFFDRMKGRRGEFYMPTFQADLVPTAGIAAAGTTLLVDGDGLEAAYDGSTTYAAIALKTTAGAWITRTVSSVTDITGGGASITVGAAWGSTVALGNIAMVCWLPVWRFASDILTMSWPRETVAEVRMAMQMLETEAVE